MKVADLSGAELDYWVARAEGVEELGLDQYGAFQRRAHGEIKPLRYSTDWSQGGPILDRERIALNPTGGVENPWQAECTGFPEGHYDGIWHGVGPTPLIAAMRAYVSSKFGEEVPDQEGA